MSYGDAAGHGIGAAGELTLAEETFVQNIAGLSYADGDMLIYNSAITRLGIGTSGQVLTVGSSGLPEWTTSAAASTTLAALTDVDIEGLGVSEVIVSNAGGTWQNQTLAEAGISATGHTHVLADITDAGTIASQDADSVSITGGTITGITDLTVADGGTGASTAAGARTNLGLVIGTDVQAFGAVLDDFNTLGAASADGEFIVATGAGAFAYESGATARTSMGVSIGSDVQAWDAFLDDIAALTDPGADRILFWDDAAPNELAWLTVGTGLTISTTTLTTDDANIDHGSLGGLADDDHTQYLLVAGTRAMTGDIDLDGNNIDDGGVIFLREQAAADVDVAGQGQIWVLTATPNELYFTNDAGTDQQIAYAGGAFHDGMSDFVANEHIDHTAVTLTAGVGLSGGGDISANRTFTVDLNELTTETAITSGDFIAMVDITDSGSGKITFANFESTLSLANQTGTVAVANGGTGQTSYTNGQLLIGNTTGNTLAKATLTGGTSITVTNGAGSITLDVDDDFLSNAGDVGTGVYDFGGATSFEIPNSATPTVDAAGEIAIDTTITDHTGLITYHEGVEALFVIAVPTANLTATDGHVIAYNATNNEFEMKAAGAADNLGDHTATEDLKMGGFNIANGGVIFLTEQAEADADVAGKGQLWVDLATPNVFMFTDDAGTDFTIAHNATTTLSSLVTVGALNSGSITSGFGTIDTGASAITTTGDITGGGIHVTGDTAAADNAALGYTATEGLIATGQGSTNDVTIKNDADGTVIAIPTGTTITALSSEIKMTERADHESTPAAGFGYLWVKSNTPSTLIFTDDAGTDTDIIAGASGDVTGDTASADKELVRFNGTGGKTIESPSTDLATTTATLSDNADLTLYDAVNDGNPVFSYGSSATERLTITVSYASGTQSLDFVEYDTPTASATADRGTHRFSVDGTAILDIEDNGIDLVTGKVIEINGTEVLSATALGDSVVGSSITSTGALNAGSITSGFGAIDNGASNITTTGDITGGGILVTGDTAAGDSAALGYTAAEGLILTGQGSTSDVTIKNDADATVLNIPTGTSTVELGVDGTVSSLILTEKASIALDPAGGADGDYSGITVAGTAGATLAFGDIVYLASVDSRWELADADAASTAGTVILGICVLAAAADGNATTILLNGIVRADAVFPTLTVGAAAYVGTTAGDIVTTAPSATDDVIRVVGFGLTTNELYFNPESGHITHT